MYLASPYNSFSAMYMSQCIVWLAGRSASRLANKVATADDSLTMVASKTFSARAETSVTSLSDFAPVCSRAACC